MQARHIVIMLLLLAAAAALCGCASPTPAPTPTAAPAAQYPMTIVDDFGRTATLQKVPERIVSLSPANTEILFDLGVGGKVVGVTDFCDYPAEVKNITRVSGFNGISYEKIAAANPDLIFCEDIVGEEAVTRMRDLGYAVIEVKNNNISAIRRNVQLMGKATGTGATATALVGDIDRRIDSISSKTAGLKEGEKPTVLMPAGYLSGQPIYVYGSNTYGDELITLAGGRNSASDIVEYQVMSTEAIIQADPDYIIIPVDGTMTTAQDFESFKAGNETWMKGLKAVKSGHVVMVDGNLMMRPGPRLPDAGLAIARAIHPELFA